MIVVFHIDGHAVPKARPRVTRRGTFMPDKYIAWRDRIAEEALVACGELEERCEPWRADAPAYRVRVRVWFAGAVHGDVDGLAGTVLDAGNKLLWADDKLVTDLRVSKSVGVPGLSVEVEALSVSPMAAPKAKRRKR